MHAAPCSWRPLTCASPPPSHHFPSATTEIHCESPHTALSRLYHDPPLPDTHCTSSPTLETHSSTADRPHTLSPRPCCQRYTHVRPDVAPNIWCEHALHERVRCCRCGEWLRLHAGHIVEAHVAWECKWLSNRVSWHYLGTVMSRVMAARRDMCGAVPGSGGI